ncbi:MAG TPA: autotransporter domain-containing protein [Rhodanobacteraceae bacterium]|nr:autotransporter domain-containing protein [Rhodanobacteraceae bacterium]
MLVTAVAAALIITSPIYLAACGGGGGGNGVVAPGVPVPPPSTTPPPAPPPPSTPPPSTPPPTTPPPSTPPPSTPPPSTPPPASYDAAFNHLIPTGALAAQQAGFTGQGVKVGILDSGVQPTAAPMAGRIDWFKSYLSGGSQSPNDTSGHGTAVADILGGSAAGTVTNSNTGATENFPGGAAPNAGLYFEQVCQVTGAGSCSIAAQNFSDFAAQGVKIINASFGSGNAQTTFTGPTDPNIANAQAQFQPAITAGILQVWAAGSSGASQPWNQAGLPYWVPSFQPYWLAVVDVAIDANGNPAGLNTSSGAPSNACGVAMQWCLAGAGSVEFPGIPGLFQSGSAGGTSAAAAEVSGVAAQVWQAFPWMSAPNISDTLLTTATPLDDGSHQTPNPTFGWGMVNAAKAIHGPAQFAFGTFTANIPTGTTATFSNAISGSGGLTLTGPGTLILSGSNTFAGATQITAGTLTVNGAITSAVNVGPGATLGGIGTVGGAVTNSGTVSSIGAAAGPGLTIGGNLTDNGSSTTAVALGTPLQVTGTVALGGTMLVVGPPTGYTVKSTETLINAGALTGTFSNLTFASGVFYTGTLSYTANQVNVALTQTAVTGAALPMASRATLLSAQNLQTALDVSNGWVASGQTAGHAQWLSDAGRFLSAPDAAAATASLDSLAGRIYATSQMIEVQQALATDVAIARHQFDAPENHVGTSLWTQSLGLAGTLAGSGQGATDYQSGGALAGFDSVFGNGVSVGLAAGHTRAYASVGALAGRYQGLTNVVAGYTQWTDNQGWYAAGRVSYASIDNQIQRALLLGTASVPLTNGRTDHTTLATLEGGRAFVVGRGATLAPYASVNRFELRQPGFAEQGSALGLTAAAQTHTAMLANLGMRYRYGFNWALGYTSLDGQVAFRRILSGAAPDLLAAFNGVPNVVFTTQGQNLPRNVGVLGLALTTQMNPRWSWYFDMNYESGSQGTRQAAADAALRFKF